MRAAAARMCSGSRKASSSPRPSAASCARSAYPRTPAKSPRRRSIREEVGERVDHVALGLALIDDLETLAEGVLGGVEVALPERDRPESLQHLLPVRPRSEEHTSEL